MDIKTRIFFTSCLRSTHLCCCSQVAKPTSYYRIASPRRIMALWKTTTLINDILIMSFSTRRRSFIITHTSGEIFNLRSFFFFFPLGFTRLFVHLLLPTFTTLREFLPPVRRRAIYSRLEPHLSVCPHL